MFRVKVVIAYIIYTMTSGLPNVYLRTYANKNVYNVKGKQKDLMKTPGFPWLTILRKYIKKCTL